VSVNIVQHDCIVQEVMNRQASIRSDV